MLITNDDLTGVRTMTPKKIIENCRKSNVIELGKLKIKHEPVKAKDVQRKDDICFCELTNTIWLIESECKKRVLNNNGSAMYWNR